MKELETSHALPDFKPKRIKILCIGNCLVNKLCAVLKLPADVDAVFVSNLYNWGNYHADSFERLAEEADFVVSINAAESLLRHSVDDLRSRYGEKLVIVPMIWLEGLTSFEMFSLNGKNMFFGADNLIAEAQQTSFEDMSKRFYQGDLQTDQRARFENSIAELKESEETTIKISDFIASHYQEFPMAAAIAHPTPNVVRELLLRLVRHIDIETHYADVFDTFQMGRLALPLGNRAFTPFDVEALGLNYPFDIDWVLNTKNLMMLLGKQIKKMNANA